MRNVHAIDTLIIYEFGMVPEVKITPLGDVHLGAPGCQFDQFKSAVQAIADEPNSYAIMMGDLLDMGLKNSVGDPYHAVMSPGDQKREMVRALMPIQSKILAWVSGNHERRLLRDTGICPTYDIAAKMDLEDRYREAMAFVRIGLGRNQHGKEFTYRLLMTHGSGGGGKQGTMITHMDDYFQAFDGVDIFVYGHSHKPAGFPGSKLMIDSQNGRILQRPTLTVCAGSWCVYEGYPAQKTMRPVALPGSNEIWLSGREWDFRAII